ncbi:hypothetical protein CsSME_00012574 [Camellia sinensis var. sinensis]
MGSLGSLRQWPQFVYALVFCLAATSVVANTPYIYASPPPPPYIYKSPPPPSPSPPPP